MPVRPPMARGHAGSPIPWRDRVISVLAGGQVLAGLVLAVAPFLTALGASGPPENYPGSVMDLKPAYGVVLAVTGIAIAILGLLARQRRRVAPALASALLAIAAGATLDSVQVVIDNPVIHRSHSVFELRGSAPWTAAIASAVALVLATGLTVVLAWANRSSGLEADMRASRVV